MVRISFTAAAVLAIALGAARADPPQPPLPAPYATPSAVNGSNVVGWPADRKPVATGPFKVTLWAEGLERVRWLYELPNGDVLASQVKGAIVSLRDKDGDGRADVSSDLLINESGNLNQPFGMALLKGDLYVANTDGLWRYPYARGDTKIAASKGRKILDFPTGGHWTRNVAASPDGSKLYATIGSASNVAEDHIGDEPGRATILEVDPATGQAKSFATGLRNPNGLAWNPITGALWTSVNERDEIGDDLVPDYVTSVKRGGFYGWPFFYFGAYPDPRKAGQRDDLAKSSLVPDLAIGSHTASLGLAFYKANAFPKRYHGGLFIGQHGSWNRSNPAGYRVVFVPFDANGSVAGPPQPFLTGFVENKDPLTVYGRPVGVIMLKDGSLLVADDAGGRIWRVAAKGPDNGDPALGGLMLFDAEHDKPIYPLGDGMTLRFDKLGTDKLTVSAPAAGPVASVRFTLDGAKLRVENHPPFTVAPHRIGKNGRLRYHAWNLAPGEHTLIATPYAGANASGKAGKSVSVTFTLR